LKITKAGVLALCLCAAPGVVSAQTMQFTDKGFVSVNFGAQVGSHDIETSSSFTLYDEPASVTTAQEVKGGGYFEIGGAYRVYKNNLLAGIAFSHTSSDATVAINATVPHPLFFDQPRTVTSSQSGAKHSENVVHLFAIYMIPVAKKLDVGVFGGPSIFSVKQDIVETVTVTETSNLAQPTITAPLTRVSRSTVGVHFGVDVQYLVGNKWGVGGTARYSVASISLPSATDHLTVGGFQIGAGARLRF
jgi:outer membrane protein with beta-barrel domain